MAQQPATSKAKRMLTRLAALTIGPRATRTILPLQASEDAALECRAQGRLPRPHNPCVVFLIPLVGRHHVNNWHEVERRLAATIESLRKQKSDRWMAVICGQNQPEGITLDKHVGFLPFDDPVEGNDKWAKLRALCQILPELGINNGYAMPLDADDLLARGAVDEMIQRENPHGYLLEWGLILDARRRQFGLCAPKSLLRPGRKAFWKMCGSCAAFRFDFRDTPHDADFLAAVTSHEHRMFPYLAKLAGRPLAPLRQLGAMYIVNHGENFGKRRGRTSFKTGYVRRFRVNGDAELAQIEAEFPMS